MSSVSALYGNRCYCTGNYQRAVHSLAQILRYTPLKITLGYFSWPKSIYFCDLSLTSCMFVNIQLREQGTNLYFDAGEFDGHRCMNLEIWIQWLYHGTDDIVQANLNYNKLKRRKNYAKVLNQTQLLIFQYISDIVLNVTKIFLHYTLLYAVFPKALFSVLYFLSSILPLLVPLFHLSI